METFLCAGHRLQASEIIGISNLFLKESTQQIWFEVYCKGYAIRIDLHGRADVSTYEDAAMFVTELLRDRSPDPEPIDFIRLVRRDIKEICWMAFQEGQTCIDETETPALKKQFAQWWQKDGDFLVGEFPFPNYTDFKPKAIQP